MKKLSWVLVPFFSFIGFAIEAKAQAPHIVRITKDTLVVATGSTYAFTVDTKENEGLVSTKADEKQLLAELAFLRGPGQYKLANYHIAEERKALSPQFRLAQQQITVNTKRNISLFFTAGQRSPQATVRFHIPAGINVTPDNVTVNVIGRGEVLLKDLPNQSIGRTGTKYSYSKVGVADISRSKSGTTLTLKELDLRPANGEDVIIVIRDVQLSKAGTYAFKADYSTSQPEVLNSAAITAKLRAVNTITDFERVLDKSLTYKETPSTYTKVSFKWSPSGQVTLMHSLDKGKTWSPSPAKNTIEGLQPNKLHAFRLSEKGKGFSNTVYFYSGKMDIKQFDLKGEDDTEKINEAIAYLHNIGGGTLLFSSGTYNVRTIHLKSNVYLYVEKDATIKALKGADAPETTWFSDKKYRSGLSPTDTGPYEDPENYMTKQDVGHHYFRNTMFFGERLDNIKIIGNGYITGNGNLNTSDKVMNNAPDSRADKMFTLKLCTNLEIGGIHRKEDLWYDEKKDEPYYMSESRETDNMLHIDRGGHFVLLTTGTDNIHVHDTYFGKQHTSSARDIYDFMACNNVVVTNIYSKVSSDDIVKPGSDCSLGFTRPASHYRVRNVIGDTNCNLFQIGSETADDIKDICVDNIYILGANKAGFSISTNDGAHIKDIHLNCGHTGTLHSRSKMYRSFTPFFISISNRARIPGAEVGKYAFTDNGVPHDELLVKNVNIGQVENIIINGIDVYEVYAGSSFSGKVRWKAYDGSQRRATPIVAGYSLPDNGIDFKLPNGNHTGYIKNIEFNDVQVLVKGGNPASDTTATPPELGVGQYNASNLKIQPSYGLWVRHVKGLTVTKSSFSTEQPDGRYPIFLDDVKGAKIRDVKVARPKDTKVVIGQKNSSGVIVENMGL
jgi:polygalacturonase